MNEAVTVGQVLAALGVLGLVGLVIGAVFWFLGILAEGFKH